MNTFAVHFFNPAIMSAIHATVRRWADQVKLFYYFGFRGLRASAAFQRWVLTNRVNVTEFWHAIHTNLCERYLNLLHYDGDTLELFFLNSDKNTFDSIWFEARDFEKYVGSRVVRMEDLRGEYGLILTARDYLETYWTMHAEDFIMDNLDKAHVTFNKNVVIKSIKKNHAKRK